MAPSPTPTAPARRHAALSLSAALLLGLALPAAARAQDQGWEIVTFDVALGLERDGTFDVTETIVARFHEPKHGIIREIPVRYAVKGHLYDIRAHLKGVTDAQGNKYHYEARDSQNKLIIKVGEAKKTITGDHTYVIRYRVLRAALWEGEHVAVRWNATGNGWRVPIGRASATLTVPMGVEPKQVAWRAFTGEYGSKGQDAALSTEGSTFRCVTDRLGPGEGVTVEADIPESQMVKPPFLAQLVWWLADNFVYGLIPAGLAACFGTWWLRGRDEPGMGSVVVQYAPPEGLTPAEVGTLVDEKVDLRDISSTLIDLAVRGAVRIEEIGSAGREPSDYRFTRVDEPVGLKSYERRLIDKVFGMGRTVDLSDLQNKFYTELPKIKSDIYKDLAARGYFAGNPQQVQAAYGCCGVLAVAGMLFGAAVLQTIWIGRVFWPPIVISGIVVGVAALLTSRYMPRKTRKGRIAWEQVKGLEEYISRAEVDDLKEQERRHVFERLLPFAVAFGLTKRWAKAFEGLYAEPPDWYRTTGGPFTMGDFGSSIDRSVTSMNNTFPTAPRSESNGSGWSSGGFSGGGSSGGGFGGGGGSSW